MTRLKRTLAGACGYALAFVALTTLAATPALASPAPGVASWPMVGHDAARTSRTAYRGPSAPVLRWVAPGLGAPSTDISGTLYAPGGDSLHALNADGAQLWSFDASGPVYTSAAVDTSGSVYFGSIEYRDPFDPVNHFFAVDSAGGRRWDSGEWLFSSPTVDASGTIYANASGYRSSDGSTVWSFAPGGDLAVGPDGTVYASNSNMVYAFSHGGTSPKWSWWTGNSAVALTRPAFDRVSGTLYVAGKDGGKVYALGTNGKLKWAFQTASTHIYGAPAIGADGTVYVAGYNNRLYAISRYGSLKWSLATPGGKTTEAPAVDANGVIYVELGGSTRGAGFCDLLAVTPAGALKWRFSLPVPVPANGVSAPVIGTDHSLYATDNVALDSIGEAVGPITIGTDRGSVTSGRQAILSGSLADSRTVGQLVVVEVKKPGRTYWSYSSDRRVYTAGGQALWQYKYTFVRGMTKGTYRFRARYGGMYSGTVNVVLR